MSRQRHVENKKPESDVQEAPKYEVAEAFWRYMLDHNQVLGTRSELGRMYNCSFKPTLSDPLHKEVKFRTILQCFASKKMNVIEKKPANDKENIVYCQWKEIAVDQSYILKRKSEERSKTQSTQKENLGRVGDFSGLKKKLVLDHRLNLARNKNGITIEPQPDEEGLVHMDVESNIMQLTVSNREDTKVLLMCSILGPPGPFIVDNLIHRIVSDSKIAELAGNSTIDFTVMLADNVNPGSYCLPIAFMFTRENEADKPFHIAKYIRAEIADDVVARLSKVKPYVPSKPVAVVHDPAVITEHGEPPYMQVPKYSIRLQEYKIPGDLRHVLNTGQLRRNFVTLNDNITPASYCHKFSKLLHVEEHQMESDIARYQMEDAKLIEEKPFLSLEVPGLSEKRPSLVRGDHLFVRKLGADGQPEKKQYEGFVHEVNLNKVLLKFSAGFHKRFIQNSLYQVDFKFSRTSLRMMHRAIEWAEPFLRLITYDGRPSSNVGDVVELKKCFDQKIAGNKEQKQAVENILVGTSKPYPYLIFGPPGTGKTVTVVEAIKQVLHNDRKSIVLACAPSNSAADLILERVAQHLIVSKSQMVRLNAFGRAESSVNKNILEYCIKDRDGFFTFPTKNQIETEYRLVVTTLISAGRLVSLGIPRSHFTHIFIDEAGQGMEPECLVPIVGLLGTNGDNAGQIVLAGDPKQLGPVLRSPVAIKYGLGMSFLERLMGKNFPCYNRREETNDYDSNMVTKLLNNYRSHPAIIQVPNEMFYDNELQPCADKIVRNSLCKWDELKKKGFPVIFEAVCGKDLREEKSPSFFNPEEVSVVLRYVKSLKEARGVSLETSEIGIISPYHRQVQKIRQELQKKPLKVRDIKVGSVEEFQGQERKVIIISTVRSSEEFLKLDAQHKLGFLKNPKRFNVAITRAKALLIVIGNPDVLCHDQHWRKFIKYCVDNGSFSGGGSGGRPFQMPEDVDQILAEKLEKLCINERSLFENEEDLTADDNEDIPWRGDEQ